MLEEICNRGGSSAMGFLPGGGGGEACHMVVFPLGKFCYGVSSGEGLPYDIPSWGTFAIWYNFRGDNLPWYFFPYHEICVWGRGERFTIEGKLYHMVLFPPWGSSVMGFLPGKVMRV